MTVISDRLRIGNKIEVIYSGDSEYTINLFHKHILIVGGITRMESLYRDFIESHGGIFEYHNGYIRNGKKKLESRLKRADIIVCPINCNSHAACIMVKNLGKKYNKTVHMLASYSLSSVVRVIQ
jgi:hypothetical protein